MRHRFHALCPYFAMFPESFAEKWIAALTSEGDVVLDPFAGRGTTPFQALIQGRTAIATDVNPVAFCVTKAKTNPPGLSGVKRRLAVLKREFDPEQFQGEADDLPEFFSYAYARSTLLQVLYLRSVLRWRISRVDAMIAALTLGALHGESARSPSYLSNQMPRTISTKPAYSIRFWQRRGYRPPERDAFDLLRRQATYRYVTAPPAGRALVFNVDMRELPRISRVRSAAIRCVVTSPPYLDVTSYEEDQWLRLWFLGGPPAPTFRRVSRDDRHENLDDYWRMIGDMWRSLGRVVDKGADVVIRIGAKRLQPQQLVDGLSGTSVLSKRTVRLLGSEVSEIRGRQTPSFRPDSKGCLVEVDCHFAVE